MKPLLSPATVTVTVMQLNGGSDQIYLDYSPYTANINRTQGGPHRYLVAAVTLNQQFTFVGYY